MRFLLILAALMLPCSAYAALRATEFYPTQEEVYENCKTAIHEADRGNLEGFYESACATRILTSFATMYNALHYISAEPMTDNEKQEVELIKKMQSRFCNLDEFVKKDYWELELAKSYVATIDKLERTPQFEKKFQQKDFFNNLAIMLAPCTKGIR